MNLIEYPAFHPDAISDEDVNILNKIARNCGYLDDSWLFGVVPTILSWRQCSIIASDLNLVMQSLRKLPLEMFDDTPEAGLRFAEKVGMKSLEIEAIERSGIELPHQDDSLFPVRWDIIFTEEGARLLEGNLGLAIGGVPSDRVNSAYDLLVKSNVDGYWRNSGKYWWTELTRSTSDQAILGIVDADKYWEESSYDATSWAIFLSDQAMNKPIPGPFSKFDFEKLISFENQHLTNVAELFSISDLALTTNGKRYLELVGRKTIKPTVSLWCEVLNSKACLAFLNEYAESMDDSQEEKKAIKRLLPETHLLKKYTPHTADRGEWILKPAISFGGEGIIAGADVPQGEWMRRAKGLSHRDQFAIVQKRVYPQKNKWPQKTINRAGTINETECTSSIHGFFTIGEDLLSVMSRSQPSNEIVVNAKSGACLSTCRFLMS